VPKDILYNYLDVPSTLQQEAVARLVRFAGSINALSVISGIPRSTLQNLVAGRTQTPSARTQARLDAAYELVPLNIEPRKSTVAVTSAQWTSRKLANLRIPSGASYWLPVLRTENTASGLGSRHYRPLQSSSPGDLLLEPGFDPAQLRHIVFGFGPK
jgi:hypothetical protein